MKKSIFSNFSIFFPKGGPFGVRIDLFFQFFKLKKNLPQWDVKNLQRNKAMKNELIWSIHQKVTRDLLWCWQNLPYLPGIGLTISALRGGGKFLPPPYENPLPFFCKQANFFKLLMTFQVETPNICWLFKILALWWLSLENPGSKIFTLIILTVNKQ